MCIRDSTATQVLAFRDRAFMEYFTHPDYLGMLRQTFGAQVATHAEGMCLSLIHI